MRRVLKPGGRLFFVEHGRSDDPSAQRWQDRLNGVEQFLADGCNFNRDMRLLIAGAGLRILTLGNYYTKGPKVATYLYRGIASPRIA